MKYTETHVWFIMMGGFEIQCTDGIRRLDVTDIKNLIARNAISVSSIAITKEEISARSKTDQLSKLITCVQILWFVIQLIGRAVQHLPTSNLELFTLGLVVCSLGTYAVYWRRPQDISLPITIPVGEGKALGDVFSEFISPRARFSHLDLGSEKGYFSLGLDTGFPLCFGQEISSSRSFRVSPFGPSWCLSNSKLVVILSTSIILLLHSLTLLIQ